MGDLLFCVLVRHRHLHGAVHVGYIIHSQPREGSSIGKDASAGGRLRAGIAGYDLAPSLTHFSPFEADLSIFSYKQNTYILAFPKTLVHEIINLDDTIALYVYSPTYFAYSTVISFVSTHVYRSWHSETTFQA
jgi:hypothetical protein